MPIKSLKTVKSQFVLFAAIALILALMGCASDVKSREGSLTGRITDKNGKLIDGALVSWAYDSKCRAYTDKNGRFALSGVSFGRQAFYVRIKHYYTQKFEANIYSGQTTDVKDILIYPKSFDFENINVSQVSATSAVVSWQTTSFTNGMVEYGITTALGSVAKENEGVYSTAHSLKLTNLTAQTAYYFKITANKEGKGHESSYIDSFSTIGVNEDKTPPPNPAGVTAVLADKPGQTVVFWQPVHDTDLKGYKIYRSESENGVFNKIGNILVPKGRERYIDAQVKPGLKYYYRVAAIDQAGNESGCGASNGILAAGTVNSDATWFKANSPYVLNADLTVGSTGKLTIDSGVEVKIADTDFYRLGAQDKIEITVKGTISANAKPEAPIIFAAEKANSPAGCWGGITFIEAANEENTLSNVVVSDAETAVKIYSSAGSFCGIKAINCQTGITAENNNGLILDNITTTRCKDGLRLNSNKNLAVTNSKFYNTETAVSSTNSEGLNISGCGFFEYSKIGIDTNEKIGMLTFSNNLFASSIGTAIVVGALSPIIEYSTFDSPYCIRVIKGTPEIKKNLFMADLSVFEKGIACIEYEKELDTLPRVGPNNITGFDVNTSYINCQPTPDSRSEAVLLLKDASGEKYDYGLSEPFPDANDPWGIKWF